MTSPTTLPRMNLERKNRYPGKTLDPARRVLAALPGARREGDVLLQTDTYFHCQKGRLKLRETQGQGAELIAYDRPDSGPIRLSAYHRVAVPDSPALRAALSSALGVREVVRKTRELWLWHNVRVHLDEVENLGRFIEFEAVLDEEANDEAISLLRLANLGAALNLRAEDDITCGYADLLGV